MNWAIRPSCHGGGVRNWIGPRITARVRFFSKKGQSSSSRPGTSNDNNGVVPRYMVQASRGLEVDINLVESDMDHAARALESKFAEICTGRSPLCIRLFLIGKAVVSALQSSGNDLNATIDGSKISVALPKLTKELRERLAGRVREHTENTKRTIRDIRATLSKSSQSFIKDINLRRQVEMALEKMYSAKIKKLDSISAEKQKELLSST